MNKHIKHFLRRNLPTFYPIYQNMFQTKDEKFFHVIRNMHWHTGQYCRYPERLKFFDEFVRRSRSLSPMTLSNLYDLMVNMEDLTPGHSEHEKSIFGVVVTIDNIVFIQEKFYEPHNQYKLDLKYKFGKRIKEGPLLEALLPLAREHLKPYAETCWQAAHFYCPELDYLKWDNQYWHNRNELNERIRIKIFEENLLPNFEDFRSGIGNPMGMRYLFTDDLIKRFEIMFDKEDLKHYWDTLRKTPILI